MASVTFSSAVATFYEVQNNWAPSQMIDGIFTGPPPGPGQGSTYGGINGWSVFNYATGQSEGADALLTLATPLSAGEYELTFTIYQNYYGNPGHILGDFALDYTTVASPTLSSSQTPVSIESASSLNGTTFTSPSPGELLANTSHNSIGTDTYTVTALVDSSSPITGIFLDALKNSSLPGGGPGGQYPNGNFVVSEFTLDAIPFAPTVTSITATTDSGATDLNAGHVITIAVAFNEAVNVTGSPFLQLNDHEIATYSSGSGTDTLNFSYTVQPGDNVLDLQVTGLNLTGGTIHDSVGGTLSGVVQGDLALQIDTTSPVPFMSNVTKDANDSLTTLSGVSEANSAVTILDGNKIVGTVTADSHGNWSLPVNIADNIHQFTETAIDVAGNTGASAGVTVYSPGTNKTLVGGSGNDFLIAAPKDTLTGGLGNDSFVFNANFGKVVVKDFDINHDVLAFSHTLFTNADAITQILSQTHDTGAGAVIAVDAHDTITLNNITKAQLAAHASDFHFF